MLTIRPVDEGSLEAAVELLERGFPEQSRAFWERGLARLADYCAAHGFGSIGSLLVANEKPVGVLLEIPSRHPVTGARVLNLSSWYVEEKYRWFAPKMLSDAIADERTTYTDFTPSDRAIELNIRLGFRTITSKLMLILLPLAALVGPAKGSVVALDKVPADALSPGQRDAIATHVGLGCIAMAVEIQGTFQPIVLDVIRRKGIPVARMIYAESPQLVVDSMGAIARFLLRRGLPLLSLPVGAHVEMKHAITWRPVYRYQIKGDWQDDTINALYSENVFLNA